MKINAIRLHALGVAVFLAGTVSSLADSSSSRKGTSVLHWTVAKTMAQANGETNATGQVNGRHARQGRADHQRLELFVRHLETNQAYHLLVVLGDDTDWTYVTPLVPNNDGAVNLRYRYSATGNGHLGRVFTALPDLLKPVSNVRQVAVANSSTQAVLVADLTMPDRFQYLVKRPLHNDGVEPEAEGWLWLRAHPNLGSLRLLTWELGTNRTYLIALDGTPMFTSTTDSLGRLNVQMSGINPLEVLNLRSFAVWNSESNSVLSTTLP